MGRLRRHRDCAEPARDNLTKPMPCPMVDFKDARCAWTPIRPCPPVLSPLSSAKLRFTKTGRPRRQPAFEQTWKMFIPQRLVADQLPDPESLIVIADGGRDVASRITATVTPQGLTAFSASASDYPTLVRARTVTWTLVGIVLVVLTLTLAVATIDRVLERRRAVVRQLALGVPGRVLRASQLAQTLLPLLAVLILGGGSADLLRRAYTRYASIPAVDIDATKPFLARLICTAASLLLVTAATIPLIRTRLTPELLKSE